MKTRNEKDQQEKRARLDALLFKGATPAKAFVGPKIPPMQDE